jgi:transposase-like protein
MARRKPHRDRPEFRAEARRLTAEREEPITKIARELGVSAQTLQEWVVAARPEPREPLTHDERSVRVGAGGEGPRSGANDECGLGR